MAGALRGQRRGGRALLAIGLSGLTLLALPVVSGSLLGILEAGLRMPPTNAAPPDAIVILSGDQQEGVSPDGRWWHGGPLTLQRDQAGAAYAKRTGAPVLVTGGAIHPWSPPIADMMAETLAKDFGIQVRWRETRSKDTWENARYSAAILHEAGIQHVWVVTHAWHMRRALVAFRRAGLDATAAPVTIDAKPDFHAGNFVPNVAAWQESYFAMHELIGWAWYELRP